MAGHDRRDGALKRGLYDSLDQAKLDFLANESDVRSRVGAVGWHFRLTPYPLDGDTATAVQRIRDHQVVPPGVLQSYIEEWAYPVFFKMVVSSEVDFNGRSWDEAAAEIPDLELLRGFFEGWVPERLVEPFADDFDAECHSLNSLISEALLIDEPSLAGKFVRMPHMPLGHGWLSRVPLHDQVWIDRRVVELCEASARLVQGGYAHLPAADSHSLAWHRFFRPGTLWESPTPAPHSDFLDALRCAAAAVRSMPTRTRQVSGRPFDHIEDYLAWSKRQVPDDVLNLGMIEDGIPWNRWNAWVEKYAEDGLVEFAGFRLTKLVHRWDLRSGEAIHICATSEEFDVALAERSRALSQLYRAALCAPPVSSPDSAKTCLQQKILDRLAGRAFSAALLAKKVPCHLRTLFKAGGITELVRCGHVANDRKIGGYYRPDCPPSWSGTGH